MGFLPQINLIILQTLTICISEHQMKVLCLYIQLVPSLKVLDELLLRYEYPGQDIPIPWKCIMR